jgi:hypothetical protein
MSTFRSEQLRQPLSLSGSFTGSFSGSLTGTASFATTASYALNAEGSALTQQLISNQDVGGNAPGTTYNIGDSLETVLRTMLIKYIAPTIGAPSLRNGGSTVLSTSVVNQVGTSITYNTASFTAAVDDPNGRYAYSASFTASGGTSGDFNYYFGDNVLGSSNALSLGSNRTATRTSDGTITFTLRAVNPETLATITAATRTITYVYPFFHGMSETDYSTTGDLSNDGGLTGSIEIKSNKTKSISGTSKYVYFAYPASYGNLTSIKDGSGFEVFSAFNKYTRDQNGAGSLWTSVSYNIYIGSWNGSTLNKTTISPAQNYTFTF